MSNVFGTYLPFIGWREYDQDVVEYMADFIDVDPDRRYSGFHIQWLGYTLGHGMRDIGPRGGFQA